MTRIVLALVVAVAATNALGQSFPSRNIQLIVPFAPGASADGTARTLGNELGKLLGVSVVVENRGGGGGVTGLQVMARSTPDGHTLAIGAAGAVSITPLLPGSVVFNPTKELTPVAKLVDVPVVIVTNADKGPKTLADAIAQAKASPQGLTYGSTGAKSSQHLAVEYLSRTTGARLVHVPYRGSAPAVNDALGGQVAFASVDLTSATALIGAGKLRALATTAPARVGVAPQIPTMAEAGFPGFASAPWLGLFAPAGTPGSVVSTISRHVGEIMQKPEIRKQANTLALEAAYLDADRFKKFLADDAAFWKGVIGRIGTLN